jgi:hypothetical protein
VLKFLWGHDPIVFMRTLYVKRSAVEPRSARLEAP